jgi:hypothetical protein
MNKSVLSRQIGELRDALGIIEAQLESGQSSREAMEDFKVAVDNVRNTIIAIMGATHSGDYRKAIGQFHVKRATELAQNVMSDVVLGSVTGDSEGWGEFQGRASDALERLDLITGSAIGRLPAKN